MGPTCKACGIDYSLSGPIKDGEEVYHLCISCADDNNPYSDREIKEYQEDYEQEINNG